MCGSTSTADHPRIRGEHAATRRDTPCCERIIPAYAGSTLGSCGLRGRPRDHPRIRGEHSPGSRSDPDGSTSSPHTRGALDHHLYMRVTSWIIPAYAGSTSPGDGGRPCSRDHPRIRGEHLPRKRRQRPVRGSSPHTRGARKSIAPGTARLRIIPAYAGSTSKPPAASSWRPDHPRIRGEHVPALPGAWTGGGSSPHTRGAPAREDHRSGFWRIIPAYAGSTRSALPTP